MCVFAVLVMVGCKSEEASSVLSSVKTGSLVFVMANVQMGFVVVALVTDRFAFKLVWSKVFSQQSCI